ncbi:MAG: Crp/Fnr family transcriptional regulator [Pseudomonadota bacterium]
MSDTEKLQRLYARLAPQQREMLIEFAEFLASRAAALPEAAEPLAEPLQIPRPPHESVVRAIKRLMQTYPMLDRGKLLHETSHYLSQHVMQGRDAVEVIDELEGMFARHYEGLRGRHKGIA